MIKFKLNIKIKYLILKTKTNIKIKYSKQNQRIKTVKPDEK
jgi:hypothetical protein